MNIGMLQKIKRRILRNPQAFRMDHWHCGTAACIAGHACLLRKRIVTRYGRVYANARDARNDEHHAYIETETQAILGITPDQFQRLCRLDREWDDWGWPEPFRSRFKRARLRKQKARIAAERIDHFIATHGEE